MAVLLHGAICRSIFYKMKFGVFLEFVICQLQKACNSHISIIILGTPISRPPVLGNQDLDLHKLYKIVQEHGGMEKVAIWHRFINYSLIHFSSDE